MQQGRPRPMRNVYVWLLIIMVFALALRVLGWLA